QEWSSYVHQLDINLKKVLTQTVVKNIEQLSAEEMELLIVTEISKLTGSLPHVVVTKKLCENLARNMNREVEQRLLFQWPVVRQSGTAPPHQIAPWTKRITHGLPNPSSSLAGLAMQTFPSRADLMAVEAREGVVALLAKHPGLCRKLSVRLFNQPLQGSHFRRQIWRLVLTNKKVRTVYLDLLKTDANKTKSVRDEAIARKCRELVQNDPTLAELRGSVGCLYAMKTVLSFFHITINTVTDLHATQIRLVAPLILAMSDYLPRDQPSELEDVVVLIEEFFGLLVQLPVYLTKQSLSWFRSYRPVFKLTSKTPENHSKTEINGVPDHQHFGLEVIKRLRLIDADVAVGVINEIVAVRSIDVALDNKRQEELCAPVIFEVLEPILDSLFCGFLAADTLLYVWDQIVLCVAAQLPTEQCIIHWLSSVAAILLYHTWIRNPQELTFRLIPQIGETMLSRSVATDTEENGSTKPKSMASNIALKSFTQRMQSAGRKLRIEDIRLLVHKLEEELENANQQANFYVEAARSSKLDLLNQTKEKATDRVVDTNSPNVNGSEVNIANETDKKKNTSDKSTSTVERKNVHRLKI
ncbi:hypothetical protein P879_00701, partial [Paragonimus westermani]